MKPLPGVLLACLPLILVGLLSIPLLRGYESIVAEQEQQGLARLTRLIATQLSQHTEVRETLLPVAGNALFAHTANNWITVDGVDEDYGELTNRRESYGIQHTLEVNEPYDDESLQFDVISAVQGNDLFLYLRATDDVVIYREPGSLSVHRNDHVQFATIAPSGRFTRYTLAPAESGVATVFEVAGPDQGSRALRPVDNIEAWWRETASGYDVEIRIPLPLVSSQFAISVTDIDDAAARQPRVSIGSASTTYAEDIGRIILPQQSLNGLLDSLGAGELQLVLLDAEGRKRAGTTMATRPGIIPITDTVAMTSSGEGQTLLAAAAAVVSTTGDASGTLIASRNTNAVTDARSQTIRLIIILTLIYTAVAALALFIFAARFNARIRRLQTAPRTPPSDVADPLSGLEEDMTQLNERIRHLEQMSRRLSHELRTPLTIVNSSLDHLTMESSDSENNIYIQRAKEGASRLGTILTAMSEASRLEQSLEPGDYEYFDITAVVEGCMRGYEVAYPDQAFSLEVSGKFDRILGLPELINQLLDKLVSNAMDFATANTTVRVQLTEADDQAVIRIINDGPLLPAPAAKLLDGTGSYRSDQNGDDIHLGLGLYIARLIAEFHGGHIQLQDQEDGGGVVATAYLPILSVRGTRP